MLIRSIEAGAGGLTRLRDLVTRSIQGSSGKELAVEWSEHRGPKEDNPLWNGFRSEQGISKQILFWPDSYDYE